MSEDRIVLRAAQQRMVTAGLNALERGEDTIVAYMHPGSGKTLGSLTLINELYRRNEIDAVAMFTPRFNLCQQYETDWREYLNLFCKPCMGRILHRDNEGSLIGLDQFGYATTYQSLVARPEIHLDLFEKFAGRIALVGDEWQTVRKNPEKQDEGTRSAHYLQRFSSLFRFKIVMSGTPYGKDGIPLLFAKYTQPNIDGFRYLEPDVEATYMEGVHEGYLRPFEYELFDGQGLFEYLDGRHVDLTISEMNEGIYRVSLHPNYWRSLVDRTVEAVREAQTIDKRLSGLIGANDQAHAKEIIKYLEDKHRVKVLLAVSDEKLAHDNLRIFKQGGYDILVTVGMAHMGYDHQPICVVCCLNSIRQWGWLDQFFARGMRVMKDIPLDMQVVRCIVPNDIRMRAYVEQKRLESQEGLRLREQDCKKRGPTEGPPTEWMGHTISAQITGIDAMGMDQENDVDSTAYDFIVEVKRKYDMGPVNITGLHRYLKDNNALPKKEFTPVLVMSPMKDMQTEREKAKGIRGDIKKIVDEFDRKLGAPIVVQWGYTYANMKFYFGAGVTGLSCEELMIRVNWLIDVFYPSNKDRFIK